MPANGGRRVGSCMDGFLRRRETTSNGPQCARLTLAQKVVYKPNCLDLRSTMSITLDAILGIATVVGTGSSQPPRSSWT
ncbi:protein of unknown function [Cupriavidus taiwanensis]|uniref:Uncharacterized protein n=1 Tax=Cupriavidus taiwanensis TaxID=164546 RepID=A0A9Q7XTU0_9BURK|nr:protein of unknown function [Cupriavidus taiwanensis]